MEKGRFKVARLMRGNFNCDHVIQHISISDSVYVQTLVCRNTGTDPATAIMHNLQFIVQPSVRHALYLGN
jgi:hypothetical protein